MPVFRIPRALWFPEPEQAHASGIVGVGGDLTPDRLLLAYRSGIFPWFSDGDPILWWSPDPRTVLHPGALHVGRSLRKRIRHGPYTLTWDTAFADVLRACATTPRPGQDGTWLTDALRAGLIGLHERGYAHSVEAWLDGRLVGGLYGVAIGATFCGESMFAHAPDASKVAFVQCVRQLARWGVTQIDCQMHTPHLARFGAVDIDRRDYLRALRIGLTSGPPPGLWRFDPDFDLTDPTPPHPT